MDNFDITSLYYTDDSVLETWNILHLELVKSTGEEIVSDFPSLIDYYRLPIFSAKSWGVFEPFLCGFCEALPVRTNSSGVYYLIHIKKTSNFLDISRSKYSVNKVSGIISRVYKYCFYNDLITDEIAFKLPREAGVELILNNRFRELVETNGLIGLDWTPLPMA